MPCRGDLIRRSAVFHIKLCSGFANSHYRYASLRKYKQPTKETVLDASRPSQQGLGHVQIDLRDNVLRFTNLGIALPFLQGSDLPPAARQLAEEGAEPSEPYTLTLTKTQGRCCTLTMWLLASMPCKPARWYQCCVSVSATQAGMVPDVHTQRSMDSVGCMMAPAL